VNSNAFDVDTRRRRTRRANAERRDGNRLGKFLTPVTSRARVREARRARAIDDEKESVRLSEERETVRVTDD